MPKYVVAAYPKTDPGCRVLFIETVTPGDKTAAIRKNFGKAARTVVVTARDKTQANERAGARLCAPRRGRR